MISWYKMSQKWGCKSESNAGGNYLLSTYIHTYIHKDNTVNSIIEIEGDTPDNNHQRKKRVTPTTTSIKNEFSDLSYL